MKLRTRVGSRSDSHQAGTRCLEEAVMTTITQAVLAFIWCFAAAAQDILPAPDLSITKTHRGDFVAGQEGTYLIGITNVGAGATTGPITVKDTLPVGMT